MSDQDFNPNSVDAVLSRIETKLDSALTKQDEHERRIQELEGAKKWLLGACVAIGVVSPPASKWLVERFFGQ